MSRKTAHSPATPSTIDHRLTIDEAAEYVGVSPSTIRRAIARGEIPARRIGPRLVRLRMSDLDRWGDPLGAGVTR